jgi:hypothetical protein
MYSVDKEANKDNPFTPSPDLPLREQFLYRFSALEEAVRSGFRRLDERMDRLQSELHDRHLEVNDRVSSLEHEFHETIAFKRQRIDGLEKRIIDLETWSKVVTARFAVILAVITVVWTIVAPVIRAAIGVPNG